jgi:hypothetical protein
LKAFFAPYMKYEGNRAQYKFINHESYINFIASNDFRKFFPELEYLFNHDDFEAVVDEPPAAHTPPVPAPRKPREKPVPPVPKPRVPRAPPLPEPVPAQKKLRPILKSKKQTTATQGIDMQELMRASEKFRVRRQAIAPGH